MEKRLFESFEVFSCLKKVNLRILSTFKRSFSKKKITKITECVYTNNAYHCWVTRQTTKQTNRKQNNLFWFCLIFIYYLLFTYYIYIVYKTKPVKLSLPQKPRRGLIGQEIGDKLFITCCLYMLTFIFCYRSAWSPLTFENGSFT